MKGVTIQNLRCFHAVVAEGSFQAAAVKLNRSHPTIIGSVKGLEDQLGIQLFDRTGYRVQLTESGKAFHERSGLLLRNLEQLGHFVAQMASGEESELRIVIGDLCPQAEIVMFLRDYLQACKVCVHFRHEAIAGPQERLFDDDADLIFHYIDKSDTRLEYIVLGDVRLVPVVAPSFLPPPRRSDLTPVDLREFLQCVIRDTARHSPEQRFFLVEGNRRCHVDDQFMKRQLILQGVAWGHLPYFLVEDDLESGRLLSIAGPDLAGNTMSIVAARIREKAHGPAAERLWRHIGSRAGQLAHPLWSHG